MQRSLAAILAIPALFNGLAMLVAGPFWYANVPGVTDTGPSTRISSRTSAWRFLPPVSRSRRGPGGRGTGRLPSPAPGSSPHMPCSIWS